MAIEYPETASKLPGDESADTDPYKCWFEYLKESDQNLWSDDVKRDFGDLKNIKFEEWWPGHRHLFETMIPAAIEELVCQDDLTACDKNEWIDDPDMAVIAIHMYLPRKDIERAFSEWLNKKIPSRRGPSKFKEDFALQYGFFKQPKTLMLRSALKVYKAVESEKLKPKEKQRTHYEIEETLGLIEKSKWSTRRNPSNKETQTQTISRYYRIAEQVMKSVVIGEFPVYNESDLDSR